MAAELLTITAVAKRSGFAASALRYYEKEGLIAAQRSPSGRRQYRREVLRRLAFIAAARHLGLTLDEIRQALAHLPDNRTPDAKDWQVISTGWRQRLDDEIRALTELRDGLTGCIGCGCLSLDRCRISNPEDIQGGRGSGATLLPEPLHPQDR